MHTSIRLIKLTVFSLLIFSCHYTYAENVLQAEPASGPAVRPDARLITVEVKDQQTAKPLPAAVTQPKVQPLAEKVPDADAKPVPSVQKASPAGKLPEAGPAQQQALAAEEPSETAAASPVQLPQVLEPSDFLKDVDTAIVEEEETEGVAAEDSPAARFQLGDLEKDFQKPDEGGFLAPIEKNVQYFSVAVKKHFTRWLSRSGRYVGMMKSILRENYLPEDLVFLALIESGFNPKAYSWAKASGPWQFIRGTAQRYGLKVDRWVDERRDPIKSTQAAARYLKDLYGMFGTWPLAMASYNAGEGNVARAVKRNGTLDFWELRKTRSLHPETKEYVPRFLAARMIAQNPGNYGFDELEYDEPFEFEEVLLDRCTDLGLVARLCGAPVEEIKDLNPELIRGCTPPTNKTYTLRVPKGTKETFLAAYNALPDSEKTARPVIARERPSRYVARRGDSLKRVASKYGVSVGELARANGIKTTAKLRKGQRLRIPSEDYPSVAVASRGSSKPSAPAAGVKAASAPASASASSRTYRVNKGDTLTGIARELGMSTKKLAELNGISSKSRVKAGQKLVTSSSVRTASVSKKTRSASKKTYKVRSGDTLWSISKRFGVSKRAICQANDMGDASDIKAGQKLVIPPSA